MTTGLYQIYRQRLLQAIPMYFVTGTASGAGSKVRLTLSRNHNLVTGDTVSVAGVGGTTEANVTATITTVASNLNKFDIDGTTFSNAWTSGGVVLMNDVTQRRNPYMTRWGVGTTPTTDEDYGDNVKAALINVTGAGTLYVVDFNQHESLSSVSGASIFKVTGLTGAPTVATSFTAKTTSTGAAGSFVGGVADANDFVFPSAGPAGSTAEALIVFKDTGTLAITNAPPANPTVYTSNSHGYQVGDSAVVYEIGGNTVANTTGAITAVTANTFTIAVDSSGGGAYTSGGFVTRGLSPLIAYIDSTGATGFQLTMNGADVTAAISSGANRLFQI